MKELQTFLLNLKGYCIGRYIDKAYFVQQVRTHIQLNMNIPKGKLGNNFYYPLKSENHMSVEFLIYFCLYFLNLGNESVKSMV